MRINSVYGLLCLLAVGCKSKNELQNVIEPPLKSELLFKSKIGSESLKAEVLISDLKSSAIKKQLFIELRKLNKVVLSDTLSIEMMEKPLIDIQDVDGDGTDDLLVEYLKPAKGSNKVAMLYLFDEKKLKLKRIANSIFFSNLTYDRNLNYISSLGFYGDDGVQIDFLKIKDDSLSTKYTITKAGHNVTAYKVENGLLIKKSEKELDADIIVPEISALEPEIKIH